MALLGFQVCLANTNINLPFYEPFDYSIGKLGSSVATGSDVWGNANKTEISVVGGSLSFPGLRDPVGNRVGVNGGAPNLFDDPRPQFAVPVAGGAMLFFVSA